MARSKTSSLTVGTSVESASAIGSLRNRLKWVVNDTLTIAWRNLIIYFRIPGVLFYYCIQPLMFILVFRYVFGGALSLSIPPGITFIDFLLPGIFAQAMTFGAVSTAIGLSEDLRKGIIERFRALPMARSAVLGGRILADLGRNVVVAVILTGIGYIVGFRIHTSALNFLAALLLMLLFAYAMSWGFACIGLIAPGVETTQILASALMVPLAIASSAFIPTSTMPGWVQAFAAHQPMTQLINATRALMEGGATASYVVQSVLWSIGAFCVFGPLAVRLYRRLS